MRATTWFERSAGFSLKGAWGGVCVALGFAVFAAAANVAFAQSYPTRPIRILVPGPAGGTTDILARLVGQRLTESLGQSVVVDNRPGASGFIAAETAARATPDGYTLLMAYAGLLAINPSLYKKLPYDPQKDFAPISVVASVTNMLVVQPQSQARNVRELINSAKQRPGKLNFGSAGVGTSTHLCGELFKSMAGIDVVHVPYKGQALALTALMGGQLDFIFIGMPSVLPQVRAGRLRALAVSSAQRSPAAPDVPTVAESGVPGFDATTWFGVLAPQRTPKPVVNRLYGEVAAMLRQQAIKQSLISQGADPVGNSPDQFSAFIGQEIKKWADVVARAGAKAE